MYTRTTLDGLNRHIYIYIYVHGCTAIIIEKIMNLRGSLGHRKITVGQVGVEMKEI